MTESTAEMASRIQQALPHLAHGTLRFFGDWFGRPWDNVDQVVHAGSTVDTLVLRFDGDETLTAWNPTGLTATESALRIELASRVRFEWFWYGRPMTPENLVYVEYTLNGEEVDFDTDFMPERFESHTDPAAPAVEMLSSEEHFEEVMRTEDRDS